LLRGVAVNEVVVHCVANVDGLVESVENPSTDKHHERVTNSTAERTTDGYMWKVIFVTLVASLGSLAGCVETTTRPLLVSERLCDDTDRTVVRRQSVWCTEVLQLLRKFAKRKMKETRHIVCLYTRARFTTVSKLAFY
jgi:hypothetical protein